MTASQTSTSETGAASAPESLNDLLGSDPASWIEQLVQTQKLAAMGTMAAMLAHEFNNILTRAINHADHALTYPDDHELARKSLNRIMANCNEAADISRAIFDFAGKSDSQRRPVSLVKLAQSAITCLGRDPAKDNIAIRTRIAPGLTVQGNPTLLQQVLYNLVLNARQAILTQGRQGGRLTLAADRTPEGRVTVRVSDTGGGIPASALPHIWKPFFSTKKADDKSDRRGIGLGLAICRWIIQDHGGTIEVESTEGEGTTFTISLPGN